MITFFEQEKTGHYIVRHNETDLFFFFNLKDKGEPQWRYLWDVRMYLHLHKLLHPTRMLISHYILQVCCSN